MKELQRVPMVPDVNYIEGRPPVVYLKGRVNLALPHRGYEKFFGVGSVPHGSEGRKVNKGPLVPGPFAYAFGLAVVIHSGSYEADNAERAAALRVEDGSRLQIDGVIYVVKVIRGEWIELEQEVA